MTPSQHAFLLFHVRHTPFQWRWHMQGAQFRVKSERGRSCTLAREELEALVEAGLVRQGPGYVVEVTEAGRARVEGPNRLKGALILENGDAT